MKNWLISRLFAIITRIKKQGKIPNPGDRNPETKKNP